MPAIDSKGPAIAAPRDIPDLLTVPETAELLRISISTVRAWVLAKPKPKIPYVKLGSRVLFRRAELEAFIQRNTVGASGARKVGA
jgi:excisionase family DNA binding protein